MVSFKYMMELFLNEVGYCKTVGANNESDMKEHYRLDARPLESALGCVNIKLITLVMFRNVFICIL